jgi:uncharacterized membrane protein
MTSPDPAVDALWKQVEEDFEDERRHRAFLESAQGAGQLALAASRYRQAAEDDPARREAVERRLEQITVLALAQLDSLKAERVARRRLGPGFLIVLVTLPALLYGLVRLFAR